MNLNRRSSAEVDKRWLGIHSLVATCFFVPASLGGWLISEWNLFRIACMTVALVSAFAVIGDTIHILLIIIRERRDREA